MRISHKTVFVILSFCIIFSPAILCATQSDTLIIKVTVIPPPTGTIIINNGDEYTNSTSVTLTLSVTGSGVDKMQFSNDNSTWSDPEAYATTKKWTLDSGDGTKTVWVKFQDKAGKWSDNYSDTIILDTTPPITSDSGIDGNWHNSNVAVTLTASDLMPAAQPDSYTKLLLHCDGSDDSTSFIDETGKSVTAYGNAQIDTSQYKFGGASGLFDGAGDYLTIGDADDWNFGTGNFTIDFWVRFNNILSGTNAFCIQWGVSGQFGFLFVYHSSLGKLRFEYTLDGSTVDAIYSDSWSPSTNIWYHIAVVRSGDTYYFFINGVAKGSGSMTGTLHNSTAVLTIGGSSSTRDYLDGWLDEYRISKGIARWIANFNPYTDSSGSGISKTYYSTDGSKPNILYANPFTLTNDGIYTIKYYSIDKAGNVEDAKTASKQVKIDKTAPTATITINNGDASTDDPDVTLSLSATDLGSGMGAGAQMQFSNDNSTWSSPENYATTKSWKLASGLGTKTVYAKFSDAVGNWSNALSDTIEVTKPGPKERLYIYLNGQRVAMEENGKKSFFHNDHLGGTNVVTDESGAQVKYLDYRPYGETKVEEGSLSIKKKFTGKELDEETGLYDYGARQYDAKSGRFISADTIDPNLSNPQSLNRYAYALNNPLKYVDPTGRYQVNINEAQPGDVGLQRTKTNLWTWLAEGAYKRFSQPNPHYAHTVIVLEVKRNKSGNIEYIRIGDLRMKPENQRRLSNVKASYPLGIRVFDPFIGGESIKNYDFFRVTNNPEEAAQAVRLAEESKRLNITFDPETGKNLMRYGKDVSSPSDTKMMCPEYINFLYGNKFHDPKEGTTLPSHIYEYQKQIKRPEK